MLKHPEHFIAHFIACISFTMLARIPPQRSIIILSGDVSTSTVYIIFYVLSNLDKKKAQSRNHKIEISCKKFYQLYYNFSKSEYSTCIIGFTNRDRFLFQVNGEYS